MMKKVISTVIAILMMFTVFAALPAAAADSPSVWDGTVPADSGKSFDGRGTEKNPYLIQSAEELAYFAMLVRKDNSDTCYKGKYFKLTTDIDLANKPWYPIGGWSTEIGLGSEQIYFAGNFDGAGHIIKNFVPATADTDGTPMHKLGLFGWVAGGTVSNVGLESSQTIVFTDNTRSAGLVGVGRYGFKISNCYYKGDITVNTFETGNTETAIGGILGWSGDTPADNSMDKFAGVYSASRTVESCYYTGTITVNDRSAASSTAFIKVGCIAGRFHDGGIAVVNCYVDCNFIVNCINERANSGGLMIGAMIAEGIATGTCEGFYCSVGIKYTGTLPKSNNLGIVLGATAQNTALTGQDIEYVVKDGSQTLTPYSSRLMHECPTWLNLSASDSFELPLMDGTSFLEEIVGEEDAETTEKGDTDTNTNTENTEGESTDTADSNVDAGTGASDDSGDEVDGGCGSVVGGSIAVIGIAVIGVGMVTRKKKNS